MHAIAPGLHVVTLKYLIPCSKQYFYNCFDVNAVLRSKIRLTGFANVLFCKSNFAIVFFVDAVVR